MLIRAGVRSFRAVRRVAAAKTPTSRLFRDVASHYRATFPGTGTGFYTAHDWNRLQAAFGLVCGASVLDVGPGNGAFLWALCKSGKYRTVSGVDTATPSMFLLREDATYVRGSVTNLPYADGSFHTVTCMEVLEHLEMEALDEAVAELRRVYRQRLICTVPFEEPEPLWWHDREGGHRQRFDLARLRGMFPSRGYAALIGRERPRPWIVVVEDARFTSRNLELVSLGRLRWECWRARLAGSLGSN